ncbi:MAG: cytochrome c-type biogenesis protein CcmH [Burkholderiaceae bacterium]|nr:cytochrome c-type biogenesis protein CcmH [Burkholderiaceae bacterium]
MARARRSRSRARRGGLWLAFALVTAVVQAAPALDTAADSVLEARVNQVAAELRCLVCQNQSLADSNASLAVDLKNQVREQLQAGRSEQQVLAYMTERYGDFVRYRPPLKASTVLLWAGPLLLVLLAALVLRWALARSQQATGGAAEWTEEASRRVSRLLDEPPA